MLKEGDKAIDFVLPDAEGKEHKLSDYRGKKVVLYFYPKDDTSGCTKEACSIRDYYSEITAKGAVVLGVSPDNQASHKKFITKYDLPFYLLSDTEHKVAESYGSWGEKKMYGRTYFGILRSTFIIDEEGTIKKAFPKVSPATHGEEILKYL